MEGVLYKWTNYLAGRRRAGPAVAVGTAGPAVRGSGPRPGGAVCGLLPAVRRPAAAPPVGRAGPGSLRRGRVAGVGPVAAVEDGAQQRLERGGCSQAAREERNGSKSMEAADTLV